MGRGRPGVRYRVAAAALHFTLRYPAVTSVVVGARTPEEIVADAGYLSSVVPEELMVELASINNQ
jgi:D-threo-aldose 1-dehydrogenase